MEEINHILGVQLGSATRYFTSLHVLAILNFLQNFH